LHGHFTPGWLQEIYLGFKKELEQKDFVLVAPTGAKDQHGHYFWNDEILALDERGTLWALSAVADEFKASGRVQILGSESRAMPALSKGVIVARDKKNLVAWKIGER